MGEEDFAEEMKDAEGFASLEEHMQECMLLFELLWQEDCRDGARRFREKRILLEERERKSEIFLPARFLRECCGLTETEYWLVLFAFCCETEEGLCLDFQRKFHEQRPTLQYALHLLSAVLPVDFLILSKLCGREGALCDMLGLPSEEYQEESGREERGLLSPPLLLNRTVFYFLLTGGFGREEWYDCFLLWEEAQNAEKIRPGEENFHREEVLPLHAKEYSTLAAYFHLAGPIRILLHGGRGTGKHTLVRRVCRKEKINGLFVKTGVILKRGKRAREKILQSLRFLCRLINPAVILELPGEMEGFPAAEIIGQIQAFLQECFINSRLVFLTETPAGAEAAKDFAEVWLELGGTLSMEEKGLALNAWLAPKERQDWQDELFSRYRINIGEWKRKQKTICLLAQAQGASLMNREIWVAGLQERSRVSGVGRVVDNRYESEELVLPEDCKRQLETVIELAEGWTGRQGLHLLFHGSSGTGKTMAASIIARRLGLPLFKVDLSKVFDKYIGETEKHMDEIFHTAQRSHYLLFFDEADALFSKRTGIRDSHDKYANVSTAYLLQRIEEYDGMLILATNLMNHFDDAFVRRIRFVIRFHNLDEDGRRSMWEKALDGERQMAEDVSFRELAQAAELSPARICSAAQVAGSLAGCGDSAVITREHLRRALELEAAKDETVVKWGKRNEKRLRECDERAAGGS